jgi:hypothetical protein
MKKPSRKRPWKPTLITGKLIEITDPAEQAELDRRFRAAFKSVDMYELRARKPKARRSK